MSGRVSLHILKRLLNAAMPELEVASKEKLLLHHFITGLIMRKATSHSTGDKNKC